jgi:hypothetical protein
MEELDRLESQVYSYLESAENRVGGRQEQRLFYGFLKILDMV